MAFVEFIPVSDLPVGDRANSTAGDFVYFTTNATLPAGPAVDSAGGIKSKGRSGAAPAVSSGSFWLVFLGVLGLVGLVFGIFSLVSLFIEIARRRVA